VGVLVGIVVGSKVGSRVGVALGWSVGGTVAVVAGLADTLVVGDGELCELGAPAHATTKAGNVRAVSKRRIG
jgi:hypothetical protein